MSKQVKTKKRVADHGEVFTAEREVNAMLDLVKQETERIDSRFLEPACGDGNFLVEILRRKLAVVKSRYKKSSSDYEKFSVVAVTSIYGVDILQDNVDDCRNRLFKIWDKEYKTHCKKEISDDCRKAVKYILERNILCGDALTLKAHDDEPIIFSEWSLVMGEMIKRIDYRFDKMLEQQNMAPDIVPLMNKYAKDSKDGQISFNISDDTEQNEEKTRVAEYKLTHYRRVHENG